MSNRSTSIVRPALYVIQPDHRPDPPSLYLLDSDEEALERAIFEAAHDMVDGYGSPTATVHRLPIDVHEVGQGKAGDLLKNPHWWRGMPGSRAKLAERLADWELFTTDFQAWERKTTVKLP